MASCSDQVTQVRGFADQQLRDPTKPEAPFNRRVSIIVQFPQEVEAEPAKGTKEGEGKEGAEGGEEHAAGKAAEKQPSGGRARRG